MMNAKYIPTTTHGPWGSGHPRLLANVEDTHVEVPLQTDIVRIGSATDADIRLSGLDAIQAEIRHDEDDEYVLVPFGPCQTSTPLKPIPSLGGTAGEILHTGARFVIGEQAFVFARDEFADHGRPYGGREGGEGTHQHRQPPRPHYAGAHAGGATGTAPVDPSGSA